MTYEQFWLMSPDLVIPFRKAHDLRVQQDNQKLWLQGLYVYEAICDTAPVLRPFSGQSKPLPYLEKPFPITEAEFDVEKEHAEKVKTGRSKAYLEAFAITFNNRFEKKGG